jgi:acetolactate synthase I/II/III large subunit
MMRVTDFIADYVYKLGVHEVFMLSGGGMMFLSDGIAKHPHLKAICNHHEQASAMAAVSYSKYNGNIGVAYLTTGCGGTNAITGVLNGWQDNTPILFISGQSKRKETVRNSGLKLRQFGVQEADIIPIVESITKFSIMVNDPDKIAYYLDKAVFLACSGRPGPVWIDVPMDVSSALIDEKTLMRFSNLEEKNDYKDEPTINEIKNFKQKLDSSKRPIILAGQGIRLSKSIPLFREFIEKTNIPVVVSRLGFDLLPTNHPLFVGCIGNKGTRPGNFAVQNADLVIAIGSRLSVSTTGHEYATFAREAKIIVVDIDPEEHKKNTVHIDSFINADAGKFLKKIQTVKFPDTTEWIKKCQHWKEKYPVCLPVYAKAKSGINLYYFIEILSNKLKDDSVVVGDAGSAVYVPPQSLKLKDRQRYITSGGQAEMGYTIPACIGISIARKKGEVIGITGDGSFQLNIQELQTIVHYDLPIKIFVWNNSGYLSIRATQTKFFEGRLIGADDTSGVSFPSLRKIAGAYGIQYYKASKSNKLADVVEKVMQYPKAVICEVICLRDQQIIPTVSAYTKEDGSLVSKPIEDMYPFLDREEFSKEMIVKPIDE